MTSTTAPAVRGRRLLPILLGAVITTAFVAGGTAVATATLPTLQTPADVAKTYLEARYAGDWSKAWAMECSLTHSFVGSYSRFAEDGAYWDEELFLPRHVVVHVGDGLHHDAGQPDGFLTVPVTVTSAERPEWSIAGDLPLVVSDGQIQVCDGGLSLGKSAGA
jgi:hypothetical protein